MLQIHSPLRLDHAFLLVVHRAKVARWVKPRGFLFAELPNLRATRIFDGAPLGHGYHVRVDLKHQFAIRIFDLSGVAFGANNID